MFLPPLTPGPSPRRGEGSKRAVMVWFESPSPLMGEGWGRGWHIMKKHSCFPSPLALLPQGERGGKSGDDVI
jgi:hypothetical protein